MKDRRIACLTYRKYPGEDWPQQEFFPIDVRLSSDPQHRPNSRLEAAYHRADKAIQNIVDLLAAA